MATARRYTTTSTVVVARDGSALVVDPALTRAEVGALAVTVRARGWHVSAAVATHAHHDHLLWDGGLGDVPRLVSPGTAGAVAQHRAELVAQAAAETDLADLALDGLEPLPPRADHLPPPWSAVGVLVHDAHAPGHTALVVGGTLLAGDMLSDREVPLLDLSVADPLGDYDAGLSLLTDELPAAATLVPGHGTITDTAGACRRADADRRYLDALATGAQVSADDDPRLADPWVRAEHERQVRHLRA